MDKSWSYDREVIMENEGKFMSVNCEVIRMCAVIMGFSVDEFSETYCGLPGREPKSLTSLEPKAYFSYRLTLHL